MVSHNAAHAQVPAKSVGIKAEQALGNGIVLGSALTALAIGGLFYVFGYKNNEPKAQPTAVVAPKTESQTVTKDLKIAVETKLPADDSREKLSRQLWTDLKARADRDGGESASLKKEIKAFFEFYTTTSSGKEAAEYYKKITANDVPPPGEKIIADFRKNFRHNGPSSGWRYLWNPSASIGESSKYVPLVWNSQTGYAADAQKFPHDAPAACVSLGQGSGHPGNGINQGTAVDRFAIAAYTLQSGEGGKLALALKASRTDLQHQGQIEVRVLVNDTLKKGMFVGNGKNSAELLIGLGVLKEGDTIYVGVGPDREDYSDTFSLDFTIYPFP
ncbi:MAG TPA: hypothetical protein VEK08_03030 [Planctomycetota bacterium]|nr:hypothetical protein [Planctomycetota bacterium]